VPCHIPVPTVLVTYVALTVLVKPWQKHYWYVDLRAGLRKLELLLHDFWAIK
jgi:hypothetical protein